jgi:hypothetical protein
MYEQELKNYRMLNELAEPDGIVIFGGNADRELPLCELKQAFSIEQGLYNRSLPELSVRDAAEWYADCAAPLHPETVLLHLGAADRGWLAENSAVILSKLPGLHSALLLKYSSLISRAIALQYIDTNSNAKPTAAPITPISNIALASSITFSSPITISNIAPTEISTTIV